MWTMIQMQTLMPLCDSDLESGLSSDGSASFIVKGRRVDAQLTKSGITLTAVPSRWPSAHKSYLTASMHSGADGAVHLPQSLVIQNRRSCCLCMAADWAACSISDAS